MENSLIFELFEELPRQGPGADACTEKMFSLLPDVPAAPTILDIGCGTGVQTLALATFARDAVITAIDVYQPYLDILKKNSDERGLGQRITTKCTSMDDLPFGPEFFDIIWAEGSVFVMGFFEGIRYWKQFLKTGGYLALSELVWFTDRPSPGTREFFGQQYPAMTTVRGNEDKINAAGYTLLSSFNFPDSAWWSNYYDPFEIRLAEFENIYAGNDEARALVEVSRKEISLFREHSDEYGYRFFLLQK
ncbi:MAG: class I SAM-dependent methyltransferase [Methanomicrobiales archaeon]|nr:class I SAM-dependent methyltransferase [Methanomicrobiales archaeon]